LGSFRKLALNTSLKVLNLKGNMLNEEVVRELRDQYALVNIYLEQVVLKGNLNINRSISHNINDECRKNLLI